MSDVEASIFCEHVADRAVQAFHRGHQVGLEALGLDPVTAVDASVGTALYLWVHSSTPSDVVVAVYLAVETAADMVRAERRVEFLTQRARRRFAYLDAQDADGVSRGVEALPVAGDPS